MRAIRCRRRRTAVQAVPDGQVDPFDPEVEPLVAGRHTDVDRRVLQLEPAQARQQPKAADTDARRDRHRQPLPGAGQCAEDILQLLHGTVGDAKKPLTVGGKSQGPVAAREKLRAERFLQAMNLATDRRLGEEEVLRGERDAHSPPDGNEPSDVIQGRKASEWARHSGLPCAPVPGHGATSASVRSWGGNPSRNIRARAYRTSAQAAHLEPQSLPPCAPSWHAARRSAKMAMIASVPSGRSPL